VESPGAGLSLSASTPLSSVAKPAEIELKERPAKVAKTEGKAATLAAGVTASAAITDYMTQQNRPYSALQVYENLHRAVKKPEVVRILDRLAEEGKLVAKSFKKNKIFLPNQSLYAEPSQDELDGMDADIKRMTDENKEAEAQLKQLERDIAALEQEPTDADADSAIAKLEAEIATKTEKLSKLSSETKLVGKEDVEKAQKAFVKYLSEWKRRKRAVKDMVDLYCENVTKKPKKFMEEQGVDTDEDNAVDIRTFEALCPKKSP